MSKAPKPGATRKPPQPADSHAEVAEWMGRVMPDLQPIVRSLDKTIRAAHSGLSFAVKWKRAFYGLPERGWVIELVAYDVSVNLVFHGGAKFDPPPPHGEGGSRYVKIRSLEEAKAPEVQGWIEQAGDVAGWGWEG